MKASVQQAAMVREHNWTPGGARMPLRLAMPPSTIKPTTRSRLDRPHGHALMTSIVKRGKDLLAPSPISEEDESAWGDVAGPRRLSYSSEVYNMYRHPPYATCLSVIALILLYANVGKLIMCMTNALTQDWLLMTMFKV